MSMADITPAAGGASAPTYIPLPRYTDDLIVVVRGDGTYEVNSRSRRGLMHHVDPVRRLCTIFVPLTLIVTHADGRVERIAIHDAHERDEEGAP